MSVQNNQSGYFRVVWVFKTLLGPLHGLLLMCTHELGWRENAAVDVQAASNVEWFVSEYEAVHVRRACEPYRSRMANLGKSAPDNFNEYPCES